MVKPTLSRPIPYAAIERHGVIGDRRTAALIAADGTLDWLCLPDYDGSFLFGALLDEDLGGYWKLGSSAMIFGNQDYRKNTTTLVTTWNTNNSRLELADTMVHPQKERPDNRESERIIVRRLFSARGQAHCISNFFARWNFGPIDKKIDASKEQIFQAGPHLIRLWTSHSLNGTDNTTYNFDLAEGEEFWAILEIDGAARHWSVEQAQQAVTDTELYWQDWLQKINYVGPRENQMKRSAMLVHLLSYAPTGAHVAAPTTSLPERVGGDWQADYRFAWLRDTSLSLKTMAQLGFTEESCRYMEWLNSMSLTETNPFQVMYGIRGQLELPQHERKDIYGYRGSLPVRFGNHAYRQHQHDAIGYFIDCAYTHLKQGGHWQTDFGELVYRAADFIAEHWHLPGNSIWELSVEQHYLSGKVMSWVALDRAIRIAAQLDENQKQMARWCSERDAIHAEILEKAWSHRLGSFRQRYEGDNLDAAGLLVPIMGLLPPDDSRCIATIERIAEVLTINGFVHRFIPSETPGIVKLPLGEYEGAFLPCTFWLATAYAKMGRITEAESILQNAEAVAGSLGLFAEGIDTRTNTFLGNSPLLFSQTEYARAVMEIAKTGTNSIHRPGI